MRDDRVTAVLADNPGHMTLEGTTTYLVGASGSGAVVVVDPGPDLPAHRRAIEAAASARDAEIAAVIVTHHHADHAEGAIWAAGWGAALHAFDPARIPGDATHLGDGDVVEAGGERLVALHTPGHASDHLCLRVESTGEVCVGDLLLGRGTAVVAWPDGDLVDYLSSLRRLAATQPTALLPAHGPRIDDPIGAIDAYRAHRDQRERQVLAAVRRGATTAAEVVAVVYADVDPVVHPAAERSVRATLDKLVADGLVAREVAPGATDIDVEPSPEGVVHRGT